MTTRTKWISGAWILSLALTSGVPVRARQAGVDPSLYSGLHWRMIGPFVDVVIADQPMIAHIAGGLHP